MKISRPEQDYKNPSLVFLVCSQEKASNMSVDEEEKQLRKTKRILRIYMIIFLIALVIFVIVGFGLMF